MLISFSSCESCLNYEVNSVGEFYSVDICQIEIYTLSTLSTSTASLVHSPGFGDKSTCPYSVGPAHAGITFSRIICLDGSAMAGISGIE